MKLATGIRLFVIAILLFAGIMKVSQSSIGDLGNDVSSWTTLLLGIFELGLALSLLGMRNVLIPWRVATLFFVCTCAYGLYFKFNGKVTCNCFGNDTPINLALLLSSVSLIGLIWHWKYPGKLAALPAKDSEFFSPANASLVGLALFGAGMFFAFSTQLGMGAVFGKSDVSFVAGSHIEMDYLNGLSQDVSITVTNHSSKARQIFGCHSLDCRINCTMPESPIEVGPSQSKTFVVHFDRQKIPEASWPQSSEDITENYFENQVPVEFSLQGQQIKHHQVSLDMVLSEKCAGYFEKIKTKVKQ